MPLFFSRPPRTQRPFPARSFSSLQPMASSLPTGRPGGRFGVVRGRFGGDSGEDWGRVWGRFGGAFLSSSCRQRSAEFHITGVSQAGYVTRHRPCRSRPALFRSSSPPIPFCCVVATVPVRSPVAMSDATHDFARRILGGQDRRLPAALLRAILRAVEPLYAGAMRLRNWPLRPPPAPHPSPGPSRHRHRQHHGRRNRQDPDGLLAGPTPASTGPPTRHPPPRLPLSRRCLQR